MSAVKNLRAMFEQKGDVSPPPADRGRSPSVQQQRQPNTSESPRPLSKVRTNFIAIEKDGRIGLQREASSDSIVSSRRKLSSGTEGETPAAIPEKPSNPFGDKLKSVATMDPIPQSPAVESEVQTQSAPVPQPAAYPTTDTVPVVETKKQVAADERQKENRGVSASKLKVESQPVVGKDKKQDTARVQNGSAAVKKTEKVTPKTSTAKTASKPAPAAIATKHTTHKSTKSPTATKTPTSPNNPRTPKLPPSKAAADNKATHPDKHTTPKAASAAMKPPASSSAKKPPSIEISPSGSTGFVKPKPKSPTRPVKLPPGLTTHTAASGARVGIPRQSLSRQSGIMPASHANRSSSRASISSNLSVSGPKNLKRQNSTISRPRPSLGPPPKQPAKDHPVTRKEKEVDESFLARMMRPTQSFASKTADKAHHHHQLTPPRKTAAPPAKRPSTRDGPIPIKKELAPKKDAATAKKPTPQPPSTRVLRKNEHLTAKDVAPVVEQKATAEQVIQVAKKVEAPPVETSTISTSAEEVAPIVEQAATAEDVISIVKEAEGELTLPKDQEPEQDKVVDTVKPDVEEPVVAEEPAAAEDPVAEKTEEASTSKEQEEPKAEAKLEAEPEEHTELKAVSEEVAEESKLEEPAKAPEPVQEIKAVNEDASPEKPADEQLEQKHEEDNFVQSEGTSTPVDDLADELENLQINGDDTKATVPAAEEKNGDKEAEVGASHALVAEKKAKVEV